MGSATRGALEAGIAALDAQKPTAATGEQLLAAARAIDSSLQLRSLLADPAVSVDDKRAIVSRVFGSLDVAAAEVLVTAAGQRWSTAADLVDGIEELGIRAAVAAAPKSAEVERELFDIQSAVASDAELELALSSKLGEPAAKAGLVSKLLEGKASAAALVIASHLVQSPRGRRVRPTLRRAAEIVASASSRVVATVTAAAPLSAAQQKRLSTALQAQYGTTPQLNVIIDPAVIGGIRVQIADDVIDGSVASRLNDLRIQLAG
ncbi:F0F1 ATP synthase subunit delta [Schumannella sp. 10F1B-5-1]|uniref:F0F1 ATP synthase subunit delta n=1 Tax=Schumannella sp. 10F1B-5-1 TaxID=2590780 RepID=UPI00113166D3|nr:F0F1 ATP synthase subunit delta [Schumannella sp. 10F1B-5-1]TPW70680.1 F0F1 ATP synthase subunit delta [Schumannella sp. 10F1B-5-1]